MEKKLPKVKLNFLLFAIIYGLSFIVIHFMLISLNIKFRFWVYLISAIIVGMSSIIGIIQQILKIKNKSIAALLIMIFIIVLALISPYIYFLAAFVYQPEYVLEKDNRKMVAYVNGFMDTYVDYYEYKNFLVVGNQIRIREYYGQGGFDPIKNKFGYEYEVVKVTYYDRYGNEIKEDEQNINVDNITEEMSNSKTELITNDTTNNFADEESEKIVSWKSSIGYKNGKFYLDYYSSNPKEVPIELENIKMHFENENTYQFINRKVVFAYNKENCVYVIYSEDRGESWETSKLESNGDVYYIHFVNEKSGFLVIFTEAAMRDTEAEFYKTFDGGKTWEKISTQVLKIDSEIEFTDENIGYYSKNEEYFATINGGVSFNKIISKEKAADIAEQEAKNSKYQYKSWKSNFKARNIDMDNSISAKLTKALSDIDRMYYWEKQWEKESYENKLMWQIRLIDENDPLTNLYIYVSAEDGRILGAGKSSD